MASNTTASMYGGAGGRGSRVSVSSLEGLRNVLRNEPKRDDVPDAPAEPAAARPPDAPAAPADDKQTLRGLNGRLSDYLGTVRKLEKENEDLQKQIDDILAKRKAPEGRDWDKIKKPQDDLKKQIKDITMENAKLLLQIDNTNLANYDFKNKLGDEEKGRKVLEVELDDLKKTTEKTKRNREQMQTEIDLVKEELDRLKQEHKEEVDALREKIKDSEVKVEIDSQNSNLSEVLKNIRYQNEKLAQKSLKDTEEWYQSKFDNIKVAEAQDNQVLKSGKSELKDLLKQKQTLEIKIQSLNSTIRHLEETEYITKVECGQRLSPLNKVIHDLEEELREVRAQVERQVDINKNLLCVKMKLEAEIANYQHLILGMTADPEGSELSLAEAVSNDQQKPDAKVPEQQEGVKKSTPSNKPAAEAKKVVEGDPISARKPQGQ